MGEQARFRILGPLQAVANGRPVDVGGPRQQVVLAMLLLQANRVVPTERLIEAMWDDAPPRSAKAQVQICVSALRQRFAENGCLEVIQTRPHGYLIEVPDGALDAHAFARLVARGRDAVAKGRLGEAIEEFRAALDCWEGSVAAGITSRVVENAGVLLDEQRTAVLEECIEAELGLGRHHNVVGELAALVTTFPLHGGFRRQHMLALHRGGRSAEALESYRAAYRLFAEELGIDPGPDLRDLEHAILTSDRSLDLPDAGPAGLPVVEALAPVTIIPRQLPLDIGDFAGRKEILEAICATLPARLGESPPPSTVPLVNVTGPSGVGKTTVTIRAGHRLSDRYPDGQLFAQLHSGNGTTVDPAHVLENFLRALGAPPLSIPETIEERSQLYRSHLAGRRVLVVLDDAGSEEQVLPLLPGSSTCAVVISSRNRLGALPGVHRFELGLLESAEALELLAHIAGPARVRTEPAAAAMLVGQCGRLPLAVRIAAAKLAARPHWTIARLVDRFEDERRRLDELVLGSLGVRASITLSYQSLEETAGRLFRRLSIMQGDDFPLWVAAALLDSDLDRAEDLMDELVQARMVDVRVRELDGAMRFSMHDLLGAYAREKLIEEEPPAERAAALERVLGSFMYLVEEAHRREYGGDFTTLHGAGLRRPISAELSAWLLVDPIAWLSGERASLVAAIRQAAQAGYDELCWDLAMTSVSLFEVESAFDAWEETHRVALAAVRRAGNRRGEAAVLHSLGSLRLSQGRMDEAVGYLRTAAATFAEIGDRHGWALSARNLAFVDRASGRFEEAFARYEEALAALREAGDVVGEIHVLSNMAGMHLQQQRPDMAEDLLEQARALCATTPHRRTRAQIEHRFGSLYVQQGDYSAAEKSIETALGIVRATGDHLGEAHALHELGIVRSRQGRAEQAEGDFARAIEQARLGGNTRIEAAGLLALGELLIATGAGPRAYAALTEALRLFERQSDEPKAERARRLLSALDTGDGPSATVADDPPLLRIVPERQDDLAERVRIARGGPA